MNNHFYIISGIVFIIILKNLCATEAKVCQIIYVDRNPISSESSSIETSKYDYSMPQKHKYQPNSEDEPQDYHVGPYYMNRQKKLNLWDTNYIDDSARETNDYYDVKASAVTTIRPVGTTAALRPKPRQSRNSEILYTNRRSEPKQEYSMWDLS